MEMLLRLPAPDIWSRDRARLPMTLSEINPELLQAAVLKHISTSKWFPTVAEIRAAQQDPGTAGILPAKTTPDDPRGQPETVVTSQLSPDNCPLIPCPLAPHHLH